MAAVLMAPALTTLGFEPLASNLFIFYFAIMSMVTPPVALSAYAAAGISGSKINETGWLAFKMALPGFLIPMIFIMNNALLLQNSSFCEIVKVSISSLAGVIALAAAVVGWLRVKTNNLERFALLVAGLLMLFPELLTDLVGVIILGLIYLLQRTKSSASSRNPGRSPVSG